jgi:pilus assembly protein Flp/PilA
MMQPGLAKRAAGFAGDDSGATAIEYGLIAAFISIAIIGSANSVGSALIDNFYNKILGGMEDAGMNMGGGDDET